MSRMLFQAGYEEGFALGEAKGMARALIRTLIRRFDLVDGALIERILKETRQYVLDAWFFEALAAPDLRALGPLIEKIHRTPLPQPSKPGERRFHL